MAELFIINGVRGGTVFPLPATTAVIGRMPDCHIQLGDPWISSYHARLEQRAGKLWVIDLQSSNGTFVNGQKAKEVAVEPGARLKFGRTEAELRAPSRRTLDNVDTVIKREGTILRSIDELRSEVESAMKTARKPGAEDPLLLARRQIAMLNQIGKELIEVADLADALAAILSATSKAIRAEHSSLLLIDEHGALVPAARFPPDAPARVSSTLVNEAMQTALQKRAGILVLDAMSDARFAQSKSIYSEGIRSCMCVPIWGDNRVLGMMVFDRGFTEPFTAEDLELTTVVGYQAALAIERTRFLERAKAGEAQRKKLLLHFSPDVAKVILSHQGEDDPLAVSLRDEVTVLFADIKGFTGMTERLPPLELAALLRDYFGEMTAAIFENGGTLDKFIGDGLMAIFGAPIPLEDAAHKAVKAALGMLRRLDALNQRLPDDRLINIRVGINTGKVIAGNVGSADRLEFTVIGDTVNTAARLESVARPGGVCVGPLTWTRTKDRFRYRSRGAQQLKGKAATVEVYELLRPGEEDTDAGD